MERVLVFGASSAIAAALARLHAARGDRLVLIARNAEKLDAVARECGAQVAGTFVADFAEVEAADTLVTRALAVLSGADRVIIAHGDLGDQLASERDFAAAEAILRANLTSVVALLVPIANALEAQGHGRIGVLGSVAGNRGRPRNYTYGSAKSALHAYLEGLRTRLYPRSVRVSTFKLGPVDSPMTRAHRKHALFAQPDDVARDVLRLMDRGVAVAYVPAYWRLIMSAVRLVPEGLFQRLSFLSGR